MRKQLLMLLTAIMMLLSVFIVPTKTAMASSLEETIIKVDDESDTISIQNWRTYFEAAFTIFNSVSNATYNVAAKNVEVDGGYGITTGSREFTKNESWAEAKVNYKNYYDSFMAMGQAAPGNSLSKTIGMTIIRNSTTARVASGNFKSNEAISAGRMAAGGYTVLYNIHDPIKWNLAVFYFLNNPPCTQCIPASEPQPFALENTKQSKYHFENNSFFTLPQQKVFKENNSISNLKTKKSILSINDLMDDHYDEELQEYVYSMKSFNSEDSIIVNDTITDVYYDIEKQATSLGFDYWDKTDSNKSSKVYWEFAGDIRNRFSVGDSISVRTEVIAINRDLNLESLDILGYQAEMIPNIDTYLLSHLQKN